MNIILNVSGKEFELSNQTLMKIPYFCNMINDCNNNENTIIFVNRSAHIFKHILALVIDPLYPFPKKYAFELDFYGIEYNNNSLYDKHQELIYKLEKLSEKHDNTESKLIELTEKYNNVKEIIKPKKTKRPIRTPPSYYRNR